MIKDTISSKELLIGAMDNTVAEERTASLKANRHPIYFKLDAGAELIVEPETVILAQKEKPQAVKS